MSLGWEAETDICVSNEKAVRLSLCIKPPPLLEYVKTLASLVGSSHILAVFEERESIKVFFDDKKYVHIIVRNCIHVMGHHIKTDYVVPPGVKVILSNVDPVISNTDLSKLLSVYGSVVSPIIRPPISQDIDLCHILSGLRYIYMSLSACLPGSIEVKYGDQLYDIKVAIEDKQILPVPHIKTDALVTCSDDDSALNMHAVNNCDNCPGPSEIEESESCEFLGPPILDVQSVLSRNLQPLVQLESNVLLPNGEVVFPDMKAVKKSGGQSSKKNNFNKTTAFKAANKIKKSVIKTRAQSSKKINFSETTAFKAANKIKKSVKKSRAQSNKNINFNKTTAFRATNKIKRYVEHNLASAKKCHYEQEYSKVQSKNTDANSACSTKITSVNSDIINVDNEQKCNEGLSQNKVVKNDTLLKFIEEVKYQRSPIDVAKSFLGPDCKTLLAFIEQLKQYQLTVNDTPLRARINRLTEVMKESLEPE